MSSMGRTLALLLAGGFASAACAEIVVENEDFRLTVGDNAVVRSLIVKATGEECVQAAEPTALFAATQDRPFNNEIKLIHPNRETTYPATSLRREGEFLYAGFAHRQYEAKVALKVKPHYMAFELVDFICDRKSTYDYLKMDIPPVASFRVLQLPVKNRKNFGDWLNASWDERAAVGVLGTSPYPDVRHELRRDCRILLAELVRGLRLRGGAAALVAAPGREAFLDAVGDLENDCGLPRGVESRRSPHVNGSIFHTCDKPHPGTIDRLLGYVKAAGFRYMTFNYYDMVKEGDSWELIGNYDWRDEYPDKEASLSNMLARVKAAGIVPGIHFMHSHIGFKSRYVTPVADSRLNKTRRFTLAAALPADGSVDEIAVQEPTTDVTMFPECRILQFGGELVSYESYTTEPPYRFRGVKRGALKTHVVAHPQGEVGGILDVSEFGSPGTCYLDQNSDLQEEIAAKLANLYNCGFEYAYFDGSEGVNVPFNFHVANAQYRQWRQFRPAPLMAEGAAKTHFGWHMLSGANAFDCFTPEEFKAKLIEHPFRQAPIVWQDMTRCNFGWWDFILPHQPGWKKWKGVDTHGTQADMWEFGQSVSVAWKCPMSVLMSVRNLERHPRTADVLETMRRWEDVRKRNLMSEADRREILADYNQEHHLLKLADGSYRIVRVEQIPVGDGKNAIRAFLFESDGFRWVTYWKGDGEGTMTLPLRTTDVALFDEYAGKPVSLAADAASVTVPTAGRLYLRTALSRADVKAAFAAARATGLARGRIRPFADGERIAFLGDSITHGGGFVADLQVAWKERHPEARPVFLNAGIQGDTAKKGYERVETDLAALRPDRVIVMFGMNDVMSGDLASYREWMTKLCDALEAKGWKVDLMTPTPYDQWNTNLTSAVTKARCEPALVDCGSVACQLAAQRGHGFVDVYEALRGLIRKCPERRHLPDRVHPDGEAHKFIAAQILEAAGEGEVDPASVVPAKLAGLCGQLLAVQGKRRLLAEYERKAREKKVSVEDRSAFFAMLDAELDSIRQRHPNDVEWYRKRHDTIKNELFGKGARLEAEEDAVREKIFSSEVK